MIRHLQTKSQLIESLGEVKSDWKDSFSVSFLGLIEEFDFNNGISENHLIQILQKDFDAGITFFRLVLEQSKDEFTETLKALFFNSKLGYGKTSFLANPGGYIGKLVEYGLLDSIEILLSRDYKWKDIIQERLKMGRGSAIKGQKRGKNLEDFVESIVSKVFDIYEVRKSFKGAKGITTAKADFCIPSTQNPSIVIEVKAYGATGSKQSDVIGDVQKIISEKRSDTYFFLVTDGITWKARMRDFERLIEFQNLGEIYRIYTQKMNSELLSDLIQIKRELNI
jgi:hypothetical protein